MLSKKIKEIRKLRELTQTQTAEQLGISRVNYNRYENGEREPDYDTLLKIADFFQVSIDYLLNRKPLNDSLQKEELTNQIIGEILKNLRQKRNYTQEDVANSLNINKKTYNDYESCVSMPDIVTLSKLADYFNVTTDYLLGRTEQLTQINDTSQDLQEKLNNLPPRERKAVELLLGICNEENAAGKNY